MSDTNMPDEITIEEKAQNQVIDAILKGWAK